MWRRKLILSLIIMSLLISGCDQQNIKLKPGTSIIDISPDGEKVLSYRDGSIYLNNYAEDKEYLIRSNTSRPMKHRFFQTWSPDGSKIAIAVKEGLGLPKLLIYDLENHALVEYSNVLRQTWLPKSNGFTVEYQKNEEFFVDVVKEGERSIPFSDDSSIAPIAWAPTEEYVSIHKITDLGEDLAIASSNGDIIHNLGQYLFQPVWSPNGQYLAYSSRNPEGLWIFDITTNEKRKISDFTGKSITWSPSSDKIAFISNHDLHVSFLNLKDIANISKKGHISESIIFKEPLEWLDNDSLVYVYGIEGFVNYEQHAEVVNVLELKSKNFKFKGRADIYLWFNKEALEFYYIINNDSKDGELRVLKLKKD